LNCYAFLNSSQSRVNPHRWTAPSNLRLEPTLLSQEANAETDEAGIAQEIKTNQYN